MAWKRSSVRSRPGPPIFQQLSRLLGTSLAGNWPEIFKHLPSPVVFALPCRSLRSLPSRFPESPACTHPNCPNSPTSNVIAWLPGNPTNRLVIIGGDTAANTPATLQNFRLYSSGIPRERLSTDPDGTTDNTSANRGVMRYVGTWGGAY